jgi:hypothetical protein
MSHLLPKYVRSQSVRGLTHLKKLVCVPKKGSRAEKLVVLGPPKNSICVMCVATHICVGCNAHALDDETRILGVYLLPEAVHRLSDVRVTLTRDKCGSQSEMADHFHFF